MNGLAIDTPLEWAVGFAPDRVVLSGVFGLRTLRYLTEAVAPAWPPIDGLRVRAIDFDEIPTFHASTGLYGFVRLPPGPRRIEITDPASRVLPWAITAAIPDRSQIRHMLELGMPPPTAPSPLLVDVALRPTVNSQLPPGMTGVWGVVREATGAAVPLARLRCATANGDAVVTYAQRDGSYLLVLPAERPASLANPAQFVFPRALIVHAPKPPLASTLLGPSFVGAVPADLDALDPDSAASPFRSRQFQLRATDGTLLAGPNPNLPVRAAERSRWDVELLP